MRNDIKSLFVFAVCWFRFSIEALYSSTSDVINLTPQNFDSRVIDSNEVWIVEFFAPWCGHCQAFVSEYSKAATALKGAIKVGAVDADQHKALGSRYGVKGFPTVKIFVPNKAPIDYSGPRTAQGLVDAGFRELKRLIDNRLSGRSSDSGRSSAENDVIELTDSNFKEKVLDSDDMWLVEFFAPWCGHCKNLEPHWKKAASELKGKVKLGALDATVYTVTANKYGVQGFPTIKFFPAGKKYSAEDYDGGRTADDIVRWAMDKYNENLPAPEVVQITDEKVLKDVCENSQLCVISFLPHILDCQSKCRNDYLEVLKQIGEKFKRNHWGYLWSEAVAQPELEDALGIGGFGYPAMAALNIRKMKYSWLRGSFSVDGINEFLRDLSYGKGSSVPVKGAKLPKIHKVEPWDGKDGEPPVEEDYGEETHSEL
ncbi:Protein disulfide-isomerase A6-like protein [Dinothrombium tinctorium]|uniref:protein disulfide-isomerase n=1 Tax=Dinothrombium tinctorium TaxID=1965070 RepID=A0A443RDY0_9ACAR|nr:Protein disulfide-isomerase A6-like protein [Dinothrombium tinctorium]